MIRATWIFLAFAGATACKPRQFNASELTDAADVSSGERSEYLSKAKVWIDGSDALVARRDLLRGPESDGVTGPDATLECRFVEPDPKDPPGGRTSKFSCDFGGAIKEAKVKYDPFYNAIEGLLPGRHNMEVYGEVLATRLLWALGFGGDTVYSVKAFCRNCPPDPWLFLQTKLTDPATGRPLLDRRDMGMGFVRTELLDADGKCTGRCERRSDRQFFPAVIEKKFDGKEIVSGGTKGWGWPELFQNLHAIPTQELERRDALAILAAFIGHMDNQATQQRLVCRDREWAKRRKSDPSLRCPSPFMIIQDAGSNFGNGWAPLQGDLKLNKLDLAKWRRLDIWAHPANCVVTIHGAPNASFGNPLNRNLVVSEAGRAFLAGLMAKLSERQIVDLFTAAHVEMAWSGEGNATSEWASAFAAKLREQILEKRCTDVARK